MAAQLTWSTVQVAIIVPSAIAWIVTTMRLIDRKVYRRLWWDDAFATLSMIALILVFAAFWARNAPAFPTSRSLRLGAYFIDALGFSSAVWMARYSILFTIIRLAPTVNSRRLLYVVAGAFGTSYAILFAQVFWRCMADPEGWMEDIWNTQCPLGRDVAIAQLITDVWSDLTLICIPVYLLRRANIGDGPRTRLIAVFTASILTSVVSLLHAGAILSDNLINEALLAFVEMSVSLLVCNLAVIVAIAFRYLRQAFRISEAVDENPRIAARQTFTTFDTSRFARMFRITDLREEIELHDMSSPREPAGDDSASVDESSGRKPAASSSALELPVDDLERGTEGTHTRRHSSDLRMSFATRDEAPNP